MGYLWKTTQQTPPPVQVGILVPQSNTKETYSRASCVLETPFWSLTVLVLSLPLIANGLCEEARGYLQNSLVLELVTPGNSSTGRPQGQPDWRRVPVRRDK